MWQELRDKVKKFHWTELSENSDEHGNVGLFVISQGGKKKNHIYIAVIFQIDRMLFKMLYYVFVLKLQ